MSVILGARLRVVFRLGVGLLVAGGLALATWAMMIFSGARAVSISLQRQADPH